MIRSHDDGELISVVKEHAKHAHNKAVTDADVKGMWKTDPASDMKKGTKKEAH